MIHHSALPANYVVAGGKSLIPIASILHASTVEISSWNQNRYFTENFGFLEPVSVMLGERYVVKQASKTVQNVPAYGYVVPFLPCLKQLLGMPEVKMYVNSMQDCESDDGFYRDFGDGEYVRNQEMLKLAESIKILAFYDDIEVVNPIGVRVKKNKLSLFFWTLLNLPPRYRSRLNSIQLLAVAKTNDCKEFGVEKLLQDFITGLKDLYAGITVEELDRTFRGGLVAFLGDTLASNLVGGFKEGVGFARKFCRTCEVTCDTSSNIVLNEQCIQ